MAEAELDYGKPIFMIERCENCSQHAWNTRHNEKKYISYANKLEEMIKEKIPEAQVVINNLPVNWWERKEFQKRIVTPDKIKADREDCLRLLPERGALDIYTVASTSEGTETICLYSKIIANVWPHLGDLAERVADYVESAYYDRQSAAELKAQYHFTGLSFKKKQLMTKTDGFDVSSQFTRTLNTSWMPTRNKSLFETDNKGRIDDDR